MHSFFQKGFEKFSYKVWNRKNVSKNIFKNPAFQGQKPKAIIILLIGIDSNFWQKFCEIQDKWFELEHPMDNKNQVRPKKSPNIESVFRLNFEATFSSKWYRSSILHGHCNLLEFNFEKGRKIVPCPLHWAWSTGSYHSKCMTKNGHFFRNFFRKIHWSKFFLDSTRKILWYFDIIFRNFNYKLTLR